MMPLTSSILEKFFKFGSLPWGYIKSIKNLWSYIKHLLKKFCGNCIKDVKLLVCKQLKFVAKIKNVVLKEICLVILLLKDGRSIVF